MNKNLFIRLALLTVCLTFMLNCQSINGAQYNPLPPGKSQINYLGPSINITADDDVEPIPDAPPKRMEIPINIEAVEDRKIVNIVRQANVTTTNPPMTTLVVITTTPKGSASSVTTSYGIVMAVLSTLTLFYLS